MAAPFSGKPVADDIRLTTTTNIPVDFQLTGTCAGTMHFEIVNPPTNGKFGFLDEDTGEGQFIPDHGFEGNDTFTYTVDDGSDESDEATVTVEVLAAVASGTPSSAPPPATPSTIPPPPPAPTGMSPAAVGAAVGAAAVTAAAATGGATPPPMPPATPTPGGPAAAPWWAPGTPVVPPPPPPAPGAPVAPAPGAPVVPPAPGAPAVPAPGAPAGGAPIVPPPPPPPAPAPAPAKTPWYRDWRWWASIAALLALIALLLWLAFGGGNCGGGAPGPIPTPPAPPTASSSGTTPPPPPPVVSGVSCPAGYTKVPLAANSCQLLGWDGERMPYEAVSSPQAGRLVVGNAPLPHQNVVSGMTDIAGEDLAICWPSAIPFGSKVAANSVMWAVYGQHANHVVQPAWYSANCDWQTRCGLRLDDPACVSYNADGSADFTKCNLVVPVPIP